MEQSKYEALKEYGFDFDEALDRFMNNQLLLEKFLGKFVQDPTYDQLCGAMEKRDSEEAFRAVHTLKGVAGNLALHGLYDACCRLTEALRGVDTMEQARLRGAGEAFDALCKKYEGTVAAIGTVLDQ